jgi:hypothetical protein
MEPFAFPARPVHATWIELLKPTVQRLCTVSRGLWSEDPLRRPQDGFPRFFRASFTPFATPLSMCHLNFRSVCTVDPAAHRAALFRRQPGLSAQVSPDWSSIPEK